MKKQIFVSLSLALSQIVFGMSVERIRPNEDFLKSLVSFHPETSSSPSSVKPNISKWTKPNRCFVAKMDSFGLDRYYSFKTNADVEALVRAVQDGGGWSVAWYYYDKIAEVYQNSGDDANRLPKVGIVIVQIKSEKKS